MITLDITGFLERPLHVLAHAYFNISGLHHPNNGDMLFIDDGFRENGFCVPNNMGLREAKKIAADQILQKLLKYGSAHKCRECAEYIICNTSELCVACNKKALT